MFLNIIVCLLISLPLLFVQHFYIAIGQTEEVARCATEYVYIVLPFVYFNMIGRVQANYAA